MGHGEGVSGITSLLKMVLSLENGLIPSTIGIKDLNPDLMLEQRNLEVVRAPKVFDTLYPRVSLNSFGYGGANAHCILESAKSHRTHTPASVDGSPDSDSPLRGADLNLATSAASQETFLLPLSAHTYKSLIQKVSDLNDMALTSDMLEKAAFTLPRGRLTFPTRGFLTVRKESVKHDICSLKPKTMSTFFGPQQCKQMKVKPLAFIFTGQGVQWPRMGSDLLRDLPSFRSIIQKLDEYLSSLSLAPSWTIQGKYVSLGISA